MLKYKIDKIVEGNPHTVYVKLFDDTEPDTILQNISLQYVTEAEFETELQRKTEKYLASVAIPDSIISSVESVFARIEGNMETMKTTVQEAVMLKGEIINVQKV